MIVVGAGISGIDAGYHLGKAGFSYRILEGRDAIGGTWDLFRYPGIRSDSDMFTLGFPFRPWSGERTIGDGAAIREYVRETAAVLGIDQHIALSHRVERASWSSETARWTVDVVVNGAERARLTCSFLFACSGYYDYASGYTPELPGRERFTGRIVHPQHWTPDIDHRGKRVVVIGSGATAVTLVPALAKDAAHVTMLQRSPSYVASIPGRDPIYLALGRVLPARVVAALTRRKNIALARLFYEYCRRFPARARKFLQGMAARELDGSVDLAHFTPRYEPWDQRLCIVPDADLFVALREGRASVVTGRIATFTEHGIALESGAELAADLVVTATGLNLKLFGGISVEVDGNRIDPAKTMLYRGIMCTGIPNFAFTIGYTNASWTLRADLVSRYVTRLLRYMADRDLAICMPRRDPRQAEQMLSPLSSGYFQRKVHELPRQGDDDPWILHQDYLRDLVVLPRATFDDSVLSFTKRSAGPR